MVLYSIYFTHNGQVVRLPHNPSELPEEKEMEPGDYNVLGLGPVSVPRLPGQRKISVSSYFPSNITGGLLGLLTTVPPETYIKFFQDAMDSGDPVLYTPVRIDETGIPYALSLTLLISEASDGMMASFRVVRRLRGGKAAGAGKYLLRTALRLAGAGVVWAVWAWGTGRI